MHGKSYVLIIIWYISKYNAFVYTFHGRKIKSMVELYQHHTNITHIGQRTEDTEMEKNN